MIKQGVSSIFHPAALQHSTVQVKPHVIKSPSRFNPIPDTCSALDTSMVLWNKKHVFCAEVPDRKMIKR